MGRDEGGLHRRCKRVAEVRRGDGTYILVELLLFRNTYLGTRVRNPLTVAGWGVMKEGSNAVANVLQKVDVAAVSRSTCVRAMDPYEVNP